MQIQNLTPEQAAMIARGVFPEVATAPEPVLTIDGHTAVISGIRFQHTDHCWRCGHYVHAYTDGGTITMGLNASRSGKTVRWFEECRTGRPEVPTVCPHCGDQRPFPTKGTRAFTKPGRPVYNAYPHQLTVWDHIRTNFPALVEVADRAAGIR